MSTNSNNGINNNYRGTSSSTKLSWLFIVSWYLLLLLLLPLDNTTHSTPITKHQRSHHQHQHQQQHQQMHRKEQHKVDPCAHASIAELIKTSPVILKALGARIFTDDDLNTLMSFKNNNEDHELDQHDDHNFAIQQEISHLNFLTSTATLETSSSSSTATPTTPTTQSTSGLGNIAAQMPSAHNGASNSDSDSDSNTITITGTHHRDTATKVKAMLKESILITLTPETIYKGASMLKMTPSSENAARDTSGSSDSTGYGDNASGRFTGHTGGYANAAEGTFQYEGQLNATLEPLACFDDNILNILPTQLIVFGKLVPAQLVDQKQHLKQLQAQQQQSTTAQQGDILHISINGLHRWNPQFENHIWKHLGWDDWSDFTLCSVTCGKGVQQRFRRCLLDNPKMVNLNLNQKMKMNFNENDEYEELEEEEDDIKADNIVNENVVDAEAVQKQQNEWSTPTDIDLNEELISADDVKNLQKVKFLNNNNKKSKGAAFEMNINDNTINSIIKRNDIKKSNNSASKKLHEPNLIEKTTAKAAKIIMSNSKPHQTQNAASNLDEVDIYDDEDAFDANNNNDDEHADIFRQEQHNIDADSSFVAPTQHIFEEIVSIEGEPELISTEAESEEVLRVFEGTNREYFQPEEHQTKQQSTSHNKLQPRQQRKRRKLKLAKSISTLFCEGYNIEQRNCNNFECNDDITDLLKFYKKFPTTDDTSSLPASIASSQVPSATTTTTVTTNDNNKSHPSRTSAAAFKAGVTAANEIDKDLESTLHSSMGAVDLEGSILTTTTLSSLPSSSSKVAVTLITAAEIKKTARPMSDGTAAKTLTSSGSFALKLSGAPSSTTPANMGFVRSWRNPLNFTLMTTFRVKNDSSITETIFSIRNATHNLYLELCHDGLRLYLERDNTSEMLPVKLNLYDFRWHQVAISIQNGDFISIYVDCSWTNSFVVSKRLFSLPLDADVEIGRGFNGELQQLLVLPDNQERKQCSTKRTSINEVKRYIIDTFIDDYGN